jgi:ribosomal protein S18 acetylase RimI-like enzyme
MGEIEIRASVAGDASWLAALWREHWGDVTVVSRGRVLRLPDQSTLIAWVDGERVGAATYHLAGDRAELASLIALASSRGIGSALVAAVAAAARAAGARRLWLITTNDNVDALRFYQRRGFRLTALHPGAVDCARRLKPAIPEIGEHGIPIRDEIELEKLL